MAFSVCLGVLWGWLVGLFLLGLSCLGEATVEQIEELEEFH